MNDFRIKQTIQALHEALAPVTANRFLYDRPKAINDKMDEFLIISLPYAIVRQVYGAGYGSMKTICDIELFTRNIGISEIDINQMDKLIQATENLFPVVHKNVRAFKPRIVFTNSDNNGFHSTLIQADIFSYS